jgi:hypothetical protein
MPLVPSFLVSPTSILGQLNIVDNSTGSDGAITDRTITLYNAANVIIFTADFPLSAGSSILISPFTADTAVSAQINWNNNVGASLYNYSVLYAYTQYAQNYVYTLTQQQQANPAFLNDQQYFQNKSKLITLIDSAINAISVGQDVLSANTAIALYQIMLNSPTLYF